MNTTTSTAPLSTRNASGFVSAALDDEMPMSWFDRTPRGSVPPPRLSSLPPVTMGDFLGDEVADAWLR